jgi:hypothetical protein
MRVNLPPRQPAKIWMKLNCIEVHRLLDEGDPKFLRDILREKITGKQSSPFIAGRP